MHARPASTGDVAALHELFSRWEIAWLGVAEQSMDEVREQLDRVRSAAEQTRLLVDGDRVLAAAVAWEHDSVLVVDPELDPQPFYADLLPWLADRPPRRVETLDADTVRKAALHAAGWRYAYSSVDLLREVTPDWRPAEPQWPDAVSVRGRRQQDTRALYDLIYRQAKWASVRGHPPRSFEQWRSVFITPHHEPDQQVLAWRGDRLVGAATGRIFDDGTGWVAQLAVAESERRQGLGRALLLAALGRRVAAGARAVGLSVMAENRHALQLYLDVGLVVDREIMSYLPG